MGIHISTKFYRAQVYLENSFTAGDIRFVDGYLPVETARPHQRRIQDIRSVGCCKNDNARICRKAIHFGKQLVQGVFTFVISSLYQVFTPGAANSVNFINEYDTRRFFLSLAEEIADGGGYNPNKHLHKI